MLRRPPSAATLPVLTASTASAVLLDLDGVILDSRVAITRSMNHALGRCGLAPREPRWLERLIGPPLTEVFETLVGARTHDPTTVAELVSHYREHYLTTAEADTFVIDGVRDALDELAKTHVLAVATSKALDVAAALASAKGLDRYLAFVEAPDPMRPAEPKILTVGRAVARLTPAARVIAMVGDRAVDMAAARRHRLTAVGVTWGFGSRTELEAAGADVILDAPIELAEVVAGQRGRP